MHPKRAAFSWLCVAVITCVAWTCAVFADDKKQASAPPEKISYYRHIRPIFQAHCQGCHQPAKARGDYVMTDYGRMVKGGASGQPAIVPGKPDQSYLLEMIIPANGKAKMPEGKPPLASPDIELIRTWIAQGAVDDTPTNARPRYDQDHPPIYTRPPVITSLDYSPDGKLLAVAGFHEVLLVDSDSGQLLARLIGLSERIQSIRFSPDGKSLAVSGGLPARMGEVQIWDVEKRRLKLSVPVGSDTVYGVSWSPNGKLVSFGCSDNTVRVIDASSGDQVLYQGAHNDWVLDTVFSVDGSHLVSVGRDMTAKLTEVATQRFVDNITSITPGALRGGIQSVARHPQRDEIVIGGSDGEVKVYRMHRITARVIGDDANLIRKMPRMKGRVFSVAVSKDGKRIAAGSSLDNSGEVDVYSYEFDTSMPDHIKAINQKVVTSRTPQEHEALEKYHTDGVKRIVRVEIPGAGVYAVAYHPKQPLVAAAGGDGVVRIVHAQTGAIVKQFSPAPVQQQIAADKKAPPKPFPLPEAPVGTEKLPALSSVVRLEVLPSTIHLSSRFEYIQLVVTAHLATGETRDVTRHVRYEAPAFVQVAPFGFVRPAGDGSGTLRIHLGHVVASVPVSSTGFAADYRVDYIRDVMPVISRLGCNAGTCHGAASGKNGFKLSLRGYDPVFDVRSFTDDTASRRVNVASPEDSLMLLKPTAGVPHVGGQLTKPGEPYYEIIRGWIAAGAKLDPATPRVVRIEIFPKDPIVHLPGDRQQFRVQALYADGRVRDVTREAFIESGNTEIAEAHPGGLLTGLRRGEAPVLARYEGNYTATTLTVMGDRSGFAWHDPPAWNRIDELVAAKWKRMKIVASDLCSDAEFIRRVHLDLTGLPPTPEQVKAFLADPRDARIKRAEVVDRLVGSEAYLDHWANKWADLLQVNSKFLGREGAQAFREWIRKELAANTPYDQFARKILTASGSNRENPAASYFKIGREPGLLLENTTHLFLGLRFNCNKCHDHPFERWTQDNYYQTAAFFAQVHLKPDPASGDRKVGGTDVESPKPLFEIVEDSATTEVKHLRTGDPVAPAFPFPAKHDQSAQATRRQLFAAWLTSPDNPYFARSYVNRVWGYLMGRGLIEPIDDIRAGNPPTNPELLDYLTTEFVHSGYDMRHLHRIICKSRTYQLSSRANKWNEDDKLNYSHALPKRLPAETLLDTVYAVTGLTPRIPGVPPGTRAAALPDVALDLPDRFLAVLGRPARESPCECERSTGLQLGPIMALVNGQTVADAINDPNNAIAKLVAAEPDDVKVIQELFLRILNRPATPAEIKACLDVFYQIDRDHQKLVAALREREAYWAQTKPKLEKERLEAVAKAKAELEAHQKAIAPKVAQMEKERQERIVHAEQELQKYEKELLPKRFAEFEARHRQRIDWVRLDPRQLTTTNPKVALVKEHDLSVRVEGDQGNVTYTVVASTDLRHITAIRLEALSDPRLPGGGPGRAGNGNFVLNQFVVEYAPKSNPKDFKRVELAKASADFNQEGFNVQEAIANPNNQKGWAVAPRTGLTHWAVFEAKTPIDAEGGVILRLRLVHNFGGGHLLGRFRLSITAHKPPVPLGLSDDYQLVVDTPAQHRDAKQSEALLKYFRSTDEELAKRQNALAEARKPLPEDPKLKELRETLAEISKPLREDDLLVQLRQDVAASEKQLANRRLTAAQDLTWALINSPAFLFNH